MKTGDVVKHRWSNPMRHYADSGIILNTETWKTPKYEYLLVEVLWSDPMFGAKVVSYPSGQLEVINETR